MFIKICSKIGSSSEHENVQKALFFQYKRALIASRRGGLLDAPKTAFLAPRASWGLGPSPGDRFWISLVAPLVLGALWDPLWMHLAPLRSPFGAFWHFVGSYFLILER